MFWIGFLAYMVKIPSAFIIFMYTCNVNVISTRYEVSSIYIYIKEYIIKEYNAEGSKTYISATLLSQHDIFSKSIPKLIKI
jgi:hypothetical protein